MDAASSSSPAQPLAKVRPSKAVAGKAAARHDDLTGSLGIYRVGEKIGKGAFGTVYKALDSESGDFVAIKRIPKDQMRPKQVQRLLAEGMLMKRLQHENVTGFRDVIDENGFIHFILEYVDSGTLSSLIVKYGPLSERLLAVYTKQILSGLAYLHSNGIVHRDIKSNNLLISNTGVIKVADFGIAHLVEGPSDALKTLRNNKDLSSNSMDSIDADVGSPYWMSPEVILLVEATPASDVWSLGCTCLELLMGKPPYYECSKAQACFRMVEDPHPPFPENLSASLNQFLLRCFVQDPRQRASAQELLAHEWLAGVQGPKSALSNSAGMPAPVPAVVVEPAPLPPPVPVAAAPAKGGNLCFRCNEKLSFKSKECAVCGNHVCKKCLHAKKVATIRGGKLGKDSWCCLDCLALSSVPADSGALPKAVKKKAVVELPPLVK